MLDKKRGDFLKEVGLDVWIAWADGAEWRLYLGDSVRAQSGGSKLFGILSFHRELYECPQFRWGIQMQSSIIAKLTYAELIEKLLAVNCRCEESEFEHLTGMRRAGAREDGMVCQVEFRGVLKETNLFLEVDDADEGDVRKYLSQA